MTTDTTEFPEPSFWMAFSGEVTGSRAKAERWIANGGTADPIYTADQLRTAIAQARVAALEEAAKACEQWGAWNDIATSCAAAIRALAQEAGDPLATDAEARFAADMRDAERYRWLRNQSFAPGTCAVHGSVWVVRRWAPKGAIPDLMSAGFGAELDASVDAAKTATEGSDALR
jgi:hypothetical protein